MKWFSRPRSRTLNVPGTGHLEELIAKAKTDPARSQHVLNEFQKTEVLVPGREGGPGEQPGMAKLDLVVVTTNGYEAIVAFSSRDLLEEARPRFPSIDKVGIYRMRGREVLELINSTSSNAGLLLNPETPSTLFLPPEAIRAIAKPQPQEPGRVVEISAGEEVFIGQPAKVPTRLVEALMHFFQSSGAVERAYLAQVYNPKGKDPPHLVVGVDLVPGRPMTFEAIVPQMGQVALQVLGQGELVDFAEIGDDRISDYMTHKTKPFYAR